VIVGDTQDYDRYMTRGPFNTFTDANDDMGSVLHDDADYDDSKVQFGLFKNKKFVKMKMPVNRK